ncbi:MAG: tetratricopeptide repeat protein [Acidaminococcales bacterium]|nr:tetratricopeptide repeat protein [Acidaminococcales bacterium]
MPDIDHGFHQSGAYPDDIRREPNRLRQEVSCKKKWRQTTKNLFFLFLFLFLPLTGNASIGPDAGAYFAAMGQKSYREGEYEASVLFFSKAILSNPEQAELYLGSAKAWVRAGNLIQAANDAREAVRIAPDREEGYFFNSYILHLLGEESEAAAGADRAIEIFPASPFAYYGRAVIWESASDFGRAIADYTEALRLYKKTPKKARKQGMHEFADCTGRPFFDENAAALYFGRGMAQSKNGNFKDAKRDLKRAVKIRPELSLYLPEGIIERPDDA